MVWRVREQADGYCRKGKAQGGGRRRSRKSPSSSPLDKWATSSTMGEAFDAQEIDVN